MHGLLILAAMLALWSAQGAETPGAAARAATRVSLPAFGDERGLQWSSSREEYDAALADTRFVLEQMTYVSDGLTVGAYVYRPTATPDHAQPVIVYNRGSHVRPTGFAGEMLVMANRFARAGYLVVAPHYRGSAGWQGRDELGGADLADLMHVATLVERVPHADATRMFLAGESRGGMMVYQALRDGFPAKAAAVWGAFTDLEALLAPGSPQSAFATRIWPDLEQRRDAIVERRSAIRWAGRLRSPVLIMHGTADEDIPVTQSERMAAELGRLGVPHKYVAFPGQQHRIGGRGAERDATTLEWFRRFGGA